MSATSTFTHSDRAARGHCPSVYLAHLAHRKQPAHPLLHRLPTLGLPLHAIAYAVAIAACGIALSAAVVQPASAQPAAASASQGAAQAFQIPAGPLAPALRSFASTSNVLLSFTEAQTSGKTTPGISGSYQPEAALATLLAGTGLRAVRLSNGGYILNDAPADTAPSAGVATLPEVVVTASANAPGITEGTGSYTTDSTSAATGLNLSLRETPQSVTVVTRQRLEDQNLNSLTQVLEQVPGLSVQGNSTPSPSATSATYSRGYMLNRFQIDGAAASPHSFSSAGQGYVGFGSLDTALYDSVSVVRGATGLLSGAGDPSGSINLVRKRPTDSFQASLTGSAGRWDQYRAVADLGGPFNDAGTVRGRVVALHDQGESWMDRYQRDQQVLYGVLDVDLSEATLLSLALEHHRGNYDNGYGNSTGFPVAFADGTATHYSGSDNPNTNWSRETQEKTALSLALEHRFNDDWRARLRYGYTDGEVDRHIGTVRGVAADGSITSFLAIKNLSPIATRSHDVDLRLDGHYRLGGRRHDLISGLNGYSSDYKFHGNQLFNSPVPANALNWNGSYPELDWASISVQGNYIKTQQYGLFLATRLHPTDELSVILGARWSWWKTRGEDLPGSIYYNPANPVYDDRKESAQFVPYVGVVYDLNESLSAYASYTEIFNPQSNKDVNDRILDPEEGKNYELGLKGEWFDGRLNASVALFETRKDNLAVRDGDNLTPSGGFAYRAASGTKGRGWELEVSGELAPGWQLQGGYARIVTNDADGNRLNTAYVPKHSFKLFSTWAPASLNGRLTVGGGLQWQSEIYTANANAILQRLRTQKSYAVASLLAQYRFTDQLSLAVNLNNVFDKSYRLDPGFHGYGAPRNLQATLKYQF